MIHPKSDCLSKNIGISTKIWQYTVILPNALIVKNCNICSHVFIENDVKIGDNVTIKNGVRLFDGITIQENVQVGPNVTFTNDKYPRAKKKFKLQRTLIKKNASIGAGSTILGGVSIGRNSMIGAGSVVTKDVPDNELWVGAPAIFKKKIYD